MVKSLRLLVFAAAIILINFGTSSADGYGICSYPDPAAAKRAFDAMMQMKKINIAVIEAAHRG